MTFLCEVMGYNPRKFKHMTVLRQRILLNLIDQPLSLSNLHREIKTDTSKSAIHKAVKKLLEENLAEKDESKVYHLTKEGRAIVLTIVIATDHEIEKDLRYQVRAHLAERIQNKTDRDRFEAETVANNLVIAGDQL